MPLTLETAAERHRLDVRDAPYFVRVSDALHLGYKKGKSVARWIVRWRVRSGYVSRTLRGVIPDDKVAANDTSVLSFDQAMTRAMNMSFDDIDSNPQKQCGFCGRSQSEVTVLVAGTSTHICDGCIRRSNEILGSNEPSVASSGGCVEVLLNPGIEFAIESAALSALIEKTAFAMAEHDERPYLNGLLIEIEPNRLRAVATNGHWLATSEASVPGVDQVQHMILARDGVIELCSWLESAPDRVTVSISDNQFHAAFGDNTACVELLLGRYPNYREVMPRHPYTVDIDRSEFAGVVEKQNVDDDRCVRVRLDAGALSTSGNQADTWTEMAVAGQSPAVDTAFNKHYLTEVLNAIDGDRVTVNFDVGQSTWRFESATRPDATYLVMPIKID